MKYILKIETKPRGTHTLSFDSRDEADTALDETIAHMNGTAPDQTVKIAGRLAVRVGDITSAEVQEDTLGEILGR